MGNRSSSAWSSLDDKTCVGVYKVMTKVVNLRAEGYDVYIGRGSKWGNPFKIGIDGNREEVIEKYREWILTQSELIQSIHELENKILGCYCKPEACHGDVLLELLAAEKLADSIYKEIKRRLNAPCILNEIFEKVEIEKK